MSQTTYINALDSLFDVGSTQQVILSESNCDLLRVTATESPKDQLETKPATKKVLCVSSRLAFTCLASDSEFAGTHGVRCVGIGTGEGLGAETRGRPGIDWDGIWRRLDRMYLVWLLKRAEGLRLEGEQLRESQWDIGAIFCLAIEAGIVGPDERPEQLCDVRLPDDYEPYDRRLPWIIKMGF